ncbi:hypothetical protein VNO77_11150 [Canavalia gladiata]|uniref:Uncharacterized protein n=1 Tax=Canavalia gladiata TaxID=3824 RepID=A0AAN9R2I3_CANGL
MAESIVKLRKIYVRFEKERLAQYSQVLHIWDSGHKSPLQKPKHSPLNQDVYFEAYLDFEQIFNATEKEDRKPKTNNPIGITLLRKAAPCRNIEGGKRCDEGGGKMTRKLNDVKREWRVLRGVGTLFSDPTPTSGPSFFNMFPRSVAPQNNYFVTIASFPNA